MAESTLPSINRRPSHTFTGFHRLALACIVTALFLASPAFATSDLGITVITGNATPTAGGAAFSWTITVTNDGPSDAVNVVMLDPLPPGTIFQNVAVVNAPSTPGYGLVCSGPPNATNGTVRCEGNLPGAAASTSTITIVAQVVENVASGVRTNTATVASDTQESNPNTLPNTASVQSNIVVDAPLSISKTATGTVARGSNVIYELTVNNGGSSTALNATIADSLPATTTFVSMFGTGAFHSGCSANASSVVTCAAVDIPSGQSRLTIVAKTSANTPLGNLDNTADITSAGTGTIAVGSSMATTTIVNP
jgi:uncharacterized repeat protein (TIGR01451 family)